MPTVSVQNSRYIALALICPFIIGSFFLKPMQAKPIPVTRPFLPPLDEVLPYFREIWDGRNLTNNGPFHQRFERELADYLGVAHLALVTNGTIALITALQALGIKGSVITTPYSFVATSHALLLNGIRPIFVDVDPASLNLNPDKIESAIQADTTAILPVHCYGTPCNVDDIRKVADRNKLKVIYDGAHAFGVTDAGGSILRHGDMSTLSFHATKVFNTFEGGAIVCRDSEIKKQVDRLKNFGIVDEVSVASVGSNGKMSELNSAVGLVQLQYIDAVLERRRYIETLYRELLKDVRGLTYLPRSQLVQGNSAYFPIFIEPSYHRTRTELIEVLASNGIVTRRYFYPLISSFPIYSSHIPTDISKLSNALDVAEKVLCLPMFPELANDQIQRICDLVRG